jgi:arylsulfatase A-like enzyme
LADKPHLILLNPDQFRADALGHVGNPAAVTPTLDRLARSEAVSFRNAFIQNPVCTPSRCSFMTGWYPHTRGHRTMHHMLRPDEPCLLKILKDSGYYVWWGGKNDLVPAQSGYEAYCDEKHAAGKTKVNFYADQSWRGSPETDAYYSFLAGRLEGTSTPDAPLHSDWSHLYGAIRRIRNRPPDQPLCIYLALEYPHPPYGVEEPFYSMIDRSRLPERIAAPEAGAPEPSIRAGIRQAQGLGEWTRERWEELRAVYLGMCARIDHQIGMIIDVLKEEGIYDQTALMVFSDHGDFTGDYGLVEKTQNTFEDCLVQVPFVIKPPAGFEVAPRVSEAMVELVDLPATVADICGLELQYTQFGSSLLDVVAGRSDRHRDAVFCEGGRLASEEHCAESQSNPDRDAGNLYWPRLKLQMSSGPEHTKASMVRTAAYKYVRRLYESDELYDLAADPQQRVNRIDDPSLAPVRDGLIDRMLRWYQETCDQVPWRADRRN